MRRLILAAALLAGCSDGPDLVEVAPAALVNPGMVQCTNQSAPPISGWVRLYADPEGWQSNQSDAWNNARCMMVSPNGNFPNLHNGGPDQWYYSSGWWVWDNVGSFHFWVPPGKCVSVAVWDGINYTGTKHSRKHCQPAGQGQWSVFSAQIPYYYGIGVSSMKTAYCDYLGQDTCNL